MEVVLTGLGAVSPEEVFEHEVTLAPPQPPADAPPGSPTAPTGMDDDDLPPISDWLRITPAPGPHGMGPGRLAGPGQPLVYHVLFAPPRGMATTVTLIITKPSGGRWRFEIQLQVRVRVGGVVTVGWRGEHRSRGLLCGREWRVA